VAKKRAKLCRLAIESCCTVRVDYICEGEEEEKEEVVVVGYILCALS